MALEFINDTSEATWLTPDDNGDEAVEVTLWLGPPTFDAYARVLELPDPEFDRQSESEISEAVLDRTPSDVELVGHTVGILHPNTRSPSDLYFLLWEGYPYSPTLPTTRRFDLAGLRQYVLARGEIGDWADWVTTNEDVHGRAFPPAFVWPADRQWCLAFDVDSHFAGVGASTEAISALLATEQLEAVQTARETPTKLYG